MTDAATPGGSTSDIAALGIDWGTTSFRAYRLGRDGSVLETRRAEAGIRAIDDGDFEGAFEQLVGDWLDASPAVPVVLSGMIGSRQGWLEAPYLACPAAVADLAAAMVPLELMRGRRAFLAPGLSTRSAEAVPDVMRGEEVQILGAVDRLGVERATLCLPGTHSKWARVDAGRVVGFSTHMTGEAFEALRRHTILGATIEHAAWDDAAFLSGIDRSGDPGGLLHHLFGVRAAGLFGELDPARSGAFLSGLVIGHELRAAAGAPGGNRGDDPVILIGEPGLVRLYGQALGRLGVASREGPPDAAARGLHRLAKHLSEGGTR
ncbi:MFS transporter [Thalassobaculum fulvum]|uniref:MFS transporter n=1 Tax=Thalassobaculum fulvum TaxID=1633335 RepID=A0A918XUM8_9PROT|nr:2-dehydro-3-deoxygalactonokinase [Thalassobaculum fulvum]GHD57548.1 MFS transporter [Thalassobaculum fulvum]